MKTNSDMRQFSTAYIEDAEGHRAWLTNQME